MPEKFSAGLHYSQRRVPFSGVSGPHWAYGGTLAVKGLKALHGADAEFQQGPYLLEASVTGNSLTSAARLASTLAHKLSQRLQLALGRLNARPSRCRVR